MSTDSGPRLFSFCRHPSSTSCHRGLSCVSQARSTIENELSTSQRSSEDSPALQRLVSRLDIFNFISRESHLSEKELGRPCGKTRAPFDRLAEADRSVGSETAPSPQGTKMNSSGSRGGWVNAVTCRATWGRKPIEADNPERIAQSSCCTVASAAPCSDQLRGFEASGSGDP
jgi:hypothetical protein